MCAGLLLLMLTGISLTMLNRPVVIVGSFSPDAGYVLAEPEARAEQTPMMARIMPMEMDTVAFVEQPVDESAYLALFRQTTVHDGQAGMVADAVVESADWYIREDSSEKPAGLYFLQLRLTDVHELTDNAPRRCQAGDSISAAIWMDVPPAMAVLPEEGKSYRFCLFTGTEGDPLDHTSQMAGLKQTWMLYGSYIAD